MLDRSGILVAIKGFEEVAQSYINRPLWRFAPTGNLPLAI
jgi:hypothetical protein